MTNESTHLLRRGSSTNNSASDDGCCDSKSGGCFSSRLKDMLLGAIVTALVAAMVVKHVDHNSANARRSFGVEIPPQPPATHSSSSSDKPEEARDKSRLRPPQSIEEMTQNLPVPIDTKYEKFQAFGFQIYTGGASALLPIPDSATDDDDRRPKFQNNPECQGRLNTLGHFDEDLEDLPDAHPITFWQCYLGLEDAVEDALRRVDIMADAVERAHTLSDPDDKTLKVFTAPEFFFRGKEGAYVFDYDEPNVGRGDSCTAGTSRLESLYMFLKILCPISLLLSIFFLSCFSLSSFEYSLSTFAGARKARRPRKVQGLDIFVWDDNCGRGQFTSGL